MDNKDLINQSKLNFKKLAELVPAEYLAHLHEALEDDLLYEIFDAGMTALRLEAGSILAEKPKPATKTYFIYSSSTGLIKIGKSSSPERRLKHLTTGAGVDLELLCVINKDIESELHQKFEASRIYGEWFSDHDGLIAKYISENLDSTND